MKTNEILANINGNGGFDNFRKWTRSEIKVWVKANFNCSDYVTNKVANELYNIY